MLKQRDYCTIDGLSEGIVFLNVIYNYKLFAQTSDFQVFIYLNLN